MVAMRILLFVVLTFSMYNQTASCQREPCSEGEAVKAENEAETLRSWDALYQSYRRFSKCDDGAIAEGYSESVARILVDHWGTLPRLGVLASSNMRFQKFVVRHVDGTVNRSDVKKITTNTIHHCPTAQSHLCKQLQIAAAEVMNESATIHKDE